MVPLTDATQQLAVEIGDQFSDVSGSVTVPHSSTGGQQPARTYVVLAV